MLTRLLAALLTLTGFAIAQTSTSYRAIGTLSPQINAAPSLIPTTLDPTAPNPQQACPGYKASDVINTAQGFKADLVIAGPDCSAFGNDISALTLEVNYQIKERLNVKIYPQFIGAQNQSWFILPSFVNAPQGDGSTTAATSNLRLDWSNDPSFQFRVSRKTTGEILFDTYGYKIIYEDQYLELVNNMVDDYNVYGLAENVHDFRLGTNFTQTFYAVDAGNTVDGNVYGTYPFYLETRYATNGSNSTSHSVYARNAHGQEWLLRNRSITYRTLGGSFDLYFLSGQNSDGTSTPTQVIKQIQQDLVGLPALQQYWTFGFHQCRWGYQNWTVMQEIVDGYASAGIQLETVWNDIDYMDQYRDFTTDPISFPVSEGQAFLARLHAAGQHYVPIVDSNIYRPNPANASDAYEPFERGAALGAFIRSPSSGDYYTGDNWPGFSVWADWLVPQSQDFWTYELTNWYNDIQYDGIWIDLSEASSFCVGSCGEGKLDQNPVHPPFSLPGDPLTFDFDYPEGFNVSNATEAASASSASASQASASSASPPLPPATTGTLGRVNPTPGVRQVDYPPYVINNVLAGHALPKGAIAPNATHNDAYNTSEYEMHNLFGYQISNATYHALLNVFPGRRPFTVGRSTFAGSGNFTSHWGGDNTATFGSMYLSIPQALQFAMSGLPMFGADTCGFTHNTDFDLCARWMELSAFFPFYRNHNVKATIAQEAYRWSSVAAATRTVMNIRYSLLTYIYTLFYYAHTEGDTVLRALAWEFPNDASLRAVDNQFLLGPSLLVTPVLTPNTNTVKGVFPGSPTTKWYDWYTLQPVEAQARENVTLDAPLEKINVHVKGGSILPLQQPGNTTTTTKGNPYALLVALDAQGTAQGSLYLDDGYSLEPNETKIVKFNYTNDTLTASIEGSYHATAPLANITIAGVSSLPNDLSLTVANQPCETRTLSLVYGGDVLYVTGIEAFTNGGAWEGELELKLKY
ncbi:MAG: hypothetical protein M1820_008212 [Bogoriella megaspora]|nr:MAG: hypothetical protein M1820_008212 [Bogoriella megaspora]